MKKRILQILAILGINLWVGFLATVAFMLFIIKGDPILAAVPAVLALPGILLQPWFVLFFLIPMGPFLAPFLTTCVSAPIYVLLDRSGKLNRAKLFYARLNIRKTNIITGSVVLCLLAVGYARYVDFPALHQGIPKTIRYSLKEIDFKYDNSRYYCVFEFLDSEWLWQAKISEEELNRLADKLRMSEIPSEQIGAQYKNMPPYWWRPVISDQVHMLATDNFSMENRGPDGWHFLATWNPEDEILHMWIKDNF